ncbi:MAG: SDR family oxidoreductase [Flavobacteriales bacterium]|nr:SDR family oxidoreductase [Flavobacteriales bacterium]
MSAPIILVTGATSGFGQAIARLFARQGYRIIITGRRAERLQSLAVELKNEHHSEVTFLCFDVRNREEVDAAIAGLPDEWKTIDVLVNNAGLALGREPVHEANPEDWATMLDTNVTGLLNVSRAIIPLMIRGKQGTIINIGSIAGKEAYPGGNVYSASKFAVEALTRSMRIDLLPHHIRVCQVAPGAAETEFSLVRFKGDADKAKNVYQGFDPLVAEDIAEATWFIASRPPHVCINDLVIMPTAQASSAHLHRSKSTT